MSKVVFDLKWAQTLDGQLCDDEDCSQWITGTEELVRTHFLRKNYDAVLVGAQTFLKDRCQLTVRHVEMAANEKQPIRIILDSRGSLLKQLRERKLDLFVSLENGDRPTVILTPEIIGFTYESKQVLFIPCDLNFALPAQQFSKNLEKALLMAETKLRRPLRKVMVEGGARILTAFLNFKMYSQVYVSLAPMLSGGLKHRIYLKRNLKEALKLNMSNLEILGKDMLSSYQKESDKNGKIRKTKLQSDFTTY